MWIIADMHAVRNELRRILPITQACSQVKCANVKLFSSCARSLRWREGRGMVSSMLVEEGESSDEG